MSATHSLLLVDDEPAVLFTLQMILEKVGYSVTTAGTACEALKLMRKANQFDAVISDLHMETQRSGFDVAEAAARLKPRPSCIRCRGPLLRNPMVGF